MWQTDVKSTWLASNVRPLIVLILVATLLLLIILDSMECTSAWSSPRDPQSPHPPHLLFRVLLPMRFRIYGLRVSLP